MKHTQTPPNIVREIRKIERQGAFRSLGENLYMVWYEDEKYDYVWAKDELQAYERTIKHEKTKHDQD